jgi:hypothetical protein
MAISFLDNVTLGDNQLQNVVIQILASDPTGVTGKLIYNSTSNVLKYYNGSGWISLTADTTLPTATKDTIGGVKLFSDTTQTVAASTVSSTASRTYGIQFNSTDQMVVNVPWTDTTTTVELNFDASDGSSSQVNNNGTMLFAQGTGITTTGDDSGTLTITNSKPFDGLTLASTTGSNSSIANSGTITIAAGAGITTTNNASGTVTIAATGSGSMSSFTLTGDSGSNQTISDSDTLDVAGGTNISTVVGATDTVTVNLDDNITLAGDLTVSGGDITLGGTGRIQGVDTVTAGTDAANKTYVDNSVVGNLVFQGGYNAATNTPDLDSSPSASIKKGWAYVVTAAGSFFTETVEVGDFLFAQSDAPTALSDWVTVQNNVGLATSSNVGIGNVVSSANGTNLAGTKATYSSGTATIGVDIKNTSVASSAIAEMEFLVYDGGDTDSNLALDINALATFVGANTGREFSGTSSSGTSHVFTHNLGTDDVMVQLFDASTKETVFAKVDRTSTNVVTVTTAASANIRCLITKIG